ncbi:LysM peptidoglycan-binding domain-containing M23 family metallopeptidase [Borreliella burgdorferi]|uniref:NlpD n=2 Tax=Borreliella burgdorferi TaxID=139 RepID=A0A0H3C2M2_BORBZ|nr:M23 family metallopeptidase [Borreliella burgdorferi]ACK74805.1 NlpD [Borreliella burgdorferi ZS7]MCS2181224.1 M23 family metallopeptidase [Borreliella burgdorferi]
MSKIFLLFNAGFFFLKIIYVFSYPEIKNFSRQDPVFSDLKIKVLKYNKKQYIPLFFYSYKVKKGDTFFKIANKINGWQSGIATINLLDSPAVSVGQEILIPSKKGVFVFDSKDYRFNNLLLATRDLAKAEKVKIKRNDRVYEFYFFDFVKNPDFGLFSGTELLFFLNANFIFPLKKFIVSSDFGFRNDPFTGNKSFHTGIDLAAPMNAEVYSSSSGIVIEAGYNDLYGNFVVVGHKNNIKSLYGHLNLYSVKIGDFVKSGEFLGRVGQTGRATGPHLHFEILKKNIPINPLKFLK